MALYRPQGVVRSVNSYKRCMVLHGIAWYCMELHGIAWYYMVLHGIVDGTVRLQLTVLPEKAMHMGGPSKHQHHCHNFSGFSLCSE